MSGGVTGKIDDFWRMDVSEFLDEVRMATGARRVDDDGGVGSDKIEDEFGFSEASRDVTRCSINFDLVRQIRNTMGSEFLVKDRLGERVVGVGGEILKKFTEGEMVGFN